MGRGNTTAKTKRWLAYACIPALFLAILFVAPSIALADTEPDTLSIESSAASRNVAESGDILFTVLYNIDWDDANDYPAAAADETFLIQLIDSGTQIAAVAPYPFYNSGYGNGVVSFYFSGTDAAALTWGEPYTIRVTSQPGWIDPIVSYDYALGSNDYCSDTDQDDNQEWLKDWIIDAAETIENSWGISDTLTTVSVTDVLTETGEAYFGRVIPGLRYLCPELYIVNVDAPDWEDEDWDDTQTGIFEDQWSGTDTWIEDSLSGIGELFGSPFIFLNVACLLGVLGMIIVSYSLYREGRPGLLLGMLIPVVATDQGFFEVAALSFIAFMFLMFIVYKIFDLQRA